MARGAVLLEEEVVVWGAVDVRWREMVDGEATMGRGEDGERGASESCVLLVVVVTVVVDVDVFGRRDGDLDVEVRNAEFDDL